MCTLKHRLDILRKAKNTTIVRREREEIRISSPSLGKWQAAERPPTVAHRVRDQTPSHLTQQQQGSRQQDLAEQVKELSAEVSRLGGQSGMSLALSQAWVLIIFF